MLIIPRAELVRKFPIASPAMAAAAGLAFLALAAGAAEANDLRDIRIGYHDPATHVVIEADGPFCAGLTLSAKPYRLTIDLSKLAGSRPDPRAYGVVARTAWAKDAPGKIQLDLKSPARVSDVFVVAAKDGKGFRRVVKLEPVGAGDFAEAQSKLLQMASAIACDAPAAPPEKTAAAPPAQMQAAKPAQQPAPIQAQKPAQIAAPAKQAAAKPAASTPAAAPPLASRVPRDKKWTVVVDPGHGGDDPGATSVSGNREKDLTLAMAQVMKKKMEATGRYRVLLTRSDDRHMPLRDRTAFADRDDAHLFVSLHADSIASKGIRGVSVYTLSNKASDSESEALAAKENSVDQRDQPSVSPLTDFDKSDLRFRLEFDDIGQIARPFRKLVIDELHRASIDTLPTPDRSAGFVVLKTRKVPSVLIEMGYLSNAADDKLLRQAKHQDRFAAAIIKAADRFFACPEVWKWFAGSEDTPTAGRGVSCGPALAEGKGADAKD